MGVVIVFIRALISLAFKSNDSQILLWSAITGHMWLSANQTFTRYLCKHVCIYLLPFVRLLPSAIQTRLTMPCIKIIIYIYYIGILIIIIIYLHGIPQNTPWMKCRALWGEPEWQMAAVSQKAIKYTSACVCTAIDYWHSMSIIYALFYGTALGSKYYV